MWRLLIIPVLVPIIMSLTIRWLEKTEVRRSINRMADESRSRDLRGPVLR